MDILYTVRNAIKNGLVKEILGGFLMPCYVCGNERFLKTRENVRRAIIYKRKCNSCSQRIIKTGKKFDDKHKLSMSLSQKKRYSNHLERRRASEIAKIAMHRPDIRKKHIEALHHSKWLKVRTDKGQLELLEKWNELGFQFIPNYQVKTENDLFYIDGYDPVHNVVLEYDAKYHLKYKQQQKDLLRQQKIINILNPKVFWRYNSVDKKFDDVYRSNIKNKTMLTSI